MCPARVPDDAVAELLGAVVLVAVIALIVAIIGIGMRSQPLPQKIPSLNAEISNESTTLYVRHMGGDPLPRSDFIIILDGVNKTAGFTGEGTDGVWGVGETLIYVSPTLPKDLKIIYQTPSTPAVVILSKILDQSVAAPPLYVVYITSSAGSHGAISPAGTIAVPVYTDQTFTFTPDAFYRIADVVVDALSVGNPSSYTFFTVIADHTIAAAFTLQTFTINATAGAGGSISPGNVSVTAFNNQPFTITPDAFYHIADVVVNGTSAGPVPSYTFMNVTANHTIAASFALNTFTINATAGSNGSISPGNVSVPALTNKTFTITPAAFYHIADVVVNGTSAGPVPSYTFVNVTANHTIAASFAPNTYIINATAGTGGSISPGNVSVTAFTNQTFTITPNTGYRILDVLVNGTSAGAVPTYTFSNVTANHTINASFTIRTFTINATAGSGGSISPTGTVTVNYGNNQTFTITPTPPYLIADVVVNGTSVGKVSSYTFMNVTTNHTINASFSLLPVANFTGTPRGGVLPLSVQFNDTSTGSPTSWSWIFGDGGTSTLQNPLYQYTSFGNYTVNLTVTNAVGSNTTSKTKYIPVCWGDNFNDNSLGSAWTTVGGTWSESGQVLSQTSTATADPKKAIISNSGQTFGTSHTITAKVRINSWVNGDMARGGVSVFSNTADGNGYNLLFHNNPTTVQFLNDKVAWGPANTFSWSTGTWYWFKLKIESGILSGKVWQDGGTEPSNWQWTYTPAARTGTVYPALNGGSSDGTVYSTDSVDDVMVCPL